MTDGRTRRREDTRQRLFVAAVDLIAEQGFSATTVDDIAARAGVAKGTVYYNFESKTVLFEELLRHGIGLLTAEFRAAVDGLPPLEALGALVRAQLEYIRRYRAFAQLLLSEMWRTNREWQQTLRLLRGEAIAVIADTVQAGVDSGDLPADLDVRTASSALFGVGLVVAVDWLVFSPDRSIDEVQESLLGIVRRVART
ncbi:MULTISPECIES: TetR/AcrR family transcriptional regulator [Micromonospora]|uniref:TetR/AcrR family transcriptional regulator n=1 Tax=Micromonospora chalcea TaxID=1874 RepID=A0ABX9Y870_MICCH|nr:MULTISPECIES: TetR/AcrR family transcriptional regulator [Micromonospora]EWM65398.1 TetR-family transcriptional regulator [Micromonospora sp. M42]MBQ1060010.1 TetR/AcrR family transcriptional regulator [Micromonospora sp. C41]MCK1805542.1 TetR/AcrR family transcriptional regulator [Micromonospora sp. R42106]MCK1834430.1 TetR/AcrR family transcriptional regulator [Micromonospora sp. R42003]MCK1844443.1 TetR/AcrR family transcriptional regulator [Micromonospora sp. R42004]